MTQFAAHVQSQLEAQHHEIAHLKMTLSPEDGLGDLAVINLIRNDFVPELSQTLPTDIHQAELIVNLRAEADPDALEAALRSALDAMNAGQGAINAALTHIEHFRPANPNPLTAWSLPMTDRRNHLASFTAIVSIAGHPFRDKAAVLEGLCQSSGLRCGRDHGKWQRVRIPPCNLSAEGPVKIAACFPDIKWLFAGAKPLWLGQHRVLNMREPAPKRFSTIGERGHATQFTRGQSATTGIGIRSSKEPRKVMNLAETSTLRVVLMEPEKGESQASSRFEKMQALLERGYSVTRATPGGNTSPNPRTSMLVVGEFTDGKRPSDLESEGLEVRFEEAAGLDTESLVQKAESMRSDASAFKHGDWKPWFPVIDYDRCTNCMQCLSFCLFGVYGVDDGDHPGPDNDQCRDCPVFRVCPEAAIVFPKYKSGPINGDKVGSKDLQKDEIDISALSAVMSDLLRTRSEKAKSRFSKERNPDKALNERMKYLNKLADSGDIPAEVLMSLLHPTKFSDEPAKPSRKPMKRSNAGRKAKKKPPITFSWIVRELGKIQKASSKVVRSWRPLLR